MDNFSMVRKFENRKARSLPDIHGPSTEKTNNDDHYRTASSR